jgi:hypothetical protein
VTVQVAIGPSPRLGALISAGHLTALLAAAAVLPGLAAAAAVLALGLSWLDSWRRHVTRSAPQAITEVVIEGTAVALRSRDGREERGPAGSLFVAPALVILTVRPPRRLLARPVVIAADAIGAEAHRRLRVRLKWGPIPADSPSGS